MRAGHGFAAGVIVLMLGASGVALGQEDADPPQAVVISGIDECVMTKPGTQSIEPGGIDRVRGEEYTCYLTSSEPIMEGEAMSTYNHDCRLTTSGSIECTMYGTAVDTDEDGGWDCTWVGGEDPRGVNWGLALETCRGTGENEGLSFVGHMALGEGRPGDLGDGTSFRGLVFEGEAPLIVLPAD
jgi:hypothetical protein